MKRQQIGELTEAVIIMALLSEGLVPLLPYGGSQRYDLVFEQAGTYFKAQCKTGRLYDGVIRFQAWNYATKTMLHPYLRKKSYAGEIDLFFVYCPETRTVYRVPIEACTKNNPYLRLNLPKNGQRKGIRWAAPYEFSKVDTISLAVAQSG